MDAPALIRYLVRDGIDAMLQRFDSLVPTAMQDALDLTNWQHATTNGAVLFYQVDRSSGIATITDAPRVLWVNAGPDPEWDTLITSAHEPGVPLAVVYRDRTVQHVTA